LREWQDNRVRVEEEQTIRLEQLEAWQRKTSEALERLEKSLEENKQTAASYVDELWQAWSGYAQAHAKLLENLKARRSG
jgi:flagellar hook-associated protein FlgK